MGVRASSWNIPAHAGKTDKTHIHAYTHEEHPRARGENVLCMSSVFAGNGTSPRTRGKRQKGLSRNATHRNIPAHAGKTRSVPVSANCGQEHPRARGENWCVSQAISTIGGTSPRTRGKLWPMAKEHFYQRNIPAHAGKTCPGCRRVRGPEEHPRARGENLGSNNWGLCVRGTSPRTRGKLWVRACWGLCGRNIPAHAGKTHPKLQRSVPPSEHPRARGENYTKRFIVRSALGTSPRMRGKRLPGIPSWLSQRNIPAHAGKTTEIDKRFDYRTEHPRARGENPPQCTALSEIIGTSPRTRGKPRRRKTRTANRRNIPAHEGKTGVCLL